MINFDKTTDINAVEQLFCEKFKTLQLHQIHIDLAEYFFALIKYSISKGKQIINMPVDLYPEISSHIKDRLAEYHTIIISDDCLIMFISALSKTRPVANMYLTYIQYWAKCNSKQEINFYYDFSDQIFKSGFPTEIDLHDLYESLKVKAATSGKPFTNLLDHKAAMGSIQVKAPAPPIPTTLF